MSLHVVDEELNGGKG
jgi:hypothetical protein